MAKDEPEKRRDGPRGTRGRASALRSPESLECGCGLGRPLVRPEVPAGLDEVQLPAHAFREPLRETRCDERIVARPEHERGAADLRHVVLPFLPDPHGRAIES